MSPVPADTESHFAVFNGVKVPRFPFLNEGHVARIESGRYEQQEVAGALRVIGPGDRVLELGAGIGLVGAVGVLNGKPARMISFEANPDLIPAIRELYELNGIADVIETRNQILLAGPDQPETIPFVIHANYLGSGIGRGANRRRRIAEIPVADFESLRREFNPTVLLMDIEGAEVDFLQHADLSGFRAMVIELHPDIYGRDVMRKCKEIIGLAGFLRLADISTRQVWTVVRPD